MTGGLMQLVAYGAHDYYLTGNPRITFNDVKYRRHTNFAIENVKWYNYEENNYSKYIYINNILDLKFDVDDKCCACNEYLLTENMECFLFNKYGNDKFLHHKCLDKIMDWNEFDEDCLSCSIYDIEQIYDELDLYKEVNVEETEDEGENNNKDGLYIDI